MVKVKVCGITNVEDALKAIELGADALGFNFFPPSPRFITPQKAKEILTELPLTVFNVALFVNEPREEVEAALEYGLVGGGRQAFGGIQFHGEESSDFCRGWAFQVIKAFRLKNQNSLVAMESFPADFYLLDSWAPGYGGSGSPFPWDWLEGLDVQRIFLAGGLGPENVGEAIQRVRPYGVDVCTRVEAKPGIKDHGKLKDFIIAAKTA